MFHPEISANSIIDLFSIVSLYLQADSTEKDEEVVERKVKTSFSRSLSEVDSKDRKVESEVKSIEKCCLES